MAARPQALAATLARALALHQAGKPEQAEPLYREVLARAPDDFDALHLLAVVLHRTGRAQAAIALFDRAIAIDASKAAAHNNRGAALRDLGRHEAALASLDRALDLDPGHAMAASNRAAVLLDLGRPAEALASSERAVALRPNAADAHYNRARCLQELGQAQAAVTAYGQVLALTPDMVAALDNRVDLLRGLGRGREALAACERLLALEPQAAARWHLHGSVLLTLDRPQEALHSFDRALALQPDHAESQHDSGHAWIALGRPDLALPRYERALALRPDMAFLPGQWLHTKLKVCDWSGLDAAVGHIAAGIEAGTPVTAPFPVTLLPLSAGQQRRAAQTFVRHQHPKVAAPLPPWPPGQRIRLGYFSADFRQHATGVLTAGLFEQHDRSRFEVIAFSFGPARLDPMRQRLQAGFDHFFDLREQTDAQIVELARQLRLDIAIDLGGFTQGSRIGIFARRAAPIQVSMIGYPGTTGASFIDGLIADAIVVPQRQRVHYSERIVAMPHSYLVNDSRRPLPGPAPSRAALGLPEAGFVFCCFNQNSKIAPPVFQRWMRLLREVKASVLWLLQDNPLATRNLRDAAQRSGVDPTRLVFAPRVSLPEHLARHGCADLFLDTLPYNAHTSACDALWAGLPVLSCIGDTFVGRVGASLLHAVGLPELAVGSADEYEALALRLVREPALLAGFRQRLVANRSICPLFDTARYARDLEAAFVELVEHQRSGSA